MERKVVLVVEDNDMNIRLVNCLFPKDKYEVLEATHAETCYQITADRHPDIILMDIQLPDIDGITATRTIRGELGMKDIPIVMLSSYSMKRDMDEAFEAGCTGYITKPIDIETFLSSVEEYLE